jgi:hypothetical protein
MYPKEKSKLSKFQLWLKTQSKLKIKDDFEKKSPIALCMWLSCSVLLSFYDAMVTICLEHASVLN